MTSLDDGPVKVGGSYDCSHNFLKSLAGIQDVITGDFNCSKNADLKNLIGGPKEVTNHYNCYSNKFSSLEGIASIIGGHLDCCDNENLKSFHLIHKQIKHAKRFFAPHLGDSAYSHILGLLLIDGLQQITIGSGYIEDCLNKHLENPNKKQRMLLAQQELIERGF